MKISKGVVKNINKKLIASTLAVTLLSLPLTGCSNVSIDDIKYSTKTEQTQDIINSVSYDTLKYCSFYNVYNNKTEERYYTIGLKDEFNGTYLIKYYDIFTGQELKYENYAFKSIETVENYLLENNNVKKEYSGLELKEILNQFVQTQQQNKKLVKEK